MIIFVSNKDQFIKLISRSLGQKNKIFSVEHGPKGGDELNLIESKKNYGWPLVSYGTRYMYVNNG